ncbi:MAG: hypothetical protein IPM93_09250 [Candidatus Obscuribacter sp.]|nr:hypothetical protein [Candidatus Obscuribacter sp.]
MDYTNAGESHSLRWDILPVHINKGRQHSKVSLLAWQKHIRLIISSANLTESGYRFNQEVAVALEVSPTEGNKQHVIEACTFLRHLLGFVPGESELATVKRARNFLRQIDSLVKDWSKSKHMTGVRQHLVFTAPCINTASQGHSPEIDERSAIEQAISRCRQHGTAPTKATVASPFFDNDSNKSPTNKAVATLCESMNKRNRRELIICVPCDSDSTEQKPRLDAPHSLLSTPARYSMKVVIKKLPLLDKDGNRRPWHAKMLALQSNDYSALLIGSSNFTQAGLGINAQRNTEANLLTIIKRTPHSRQPGYLEAVWPEMVEVSDPSAADWSGSNSTIEEGLANTAECIPAGFVAATYNAGEKRSIVLLFDAAHLPDEWSIRMPDKPYEILLDSNTWQRKGASRKTELEWTPTEPPRTLSVSWADGTARWAVNVEDPRLLAAPIKLDEMSAENMLTLVASSNPGTAYHLYTKSPDHPSVENDWDKASPSDLDPLRRYKINTTFLWRIRQRTKVLSALREKLQRPFWSPQGLDCQLHGFFGIAPLAQRFLAETLNNGTVNTEALLALADLLIVLSEVEYTQAEGAIGREEFESIYKPFVRTLAEDLNKTVLDFRGNISADILNFWNSVVNRCKN